MYLQIIKLRQIDYIYDYIILLVMWLKNISSLFILTRHNKNSILTSTIRNVIGLSSISRLTDLIDTILPILNIKLTNSAIFLLNWTKISSHYNALSWLMLSIGWVKIFKYINNLLNLISLYYELVD